MPTEAEIQELYTALELDAPEEGQLDSSAADSSSGDSGRSVYNLTVRRSRIGTRSWSIAITSGLQPWSRLITFIKRSSMIASRGKQLEQRLMS